MNLQDDAVRMLTAQEFAKLLQVSMRTLWRMDSGGRIPEAIRMGGVVRWRSDDVRTWIAEGCPARSSRGSDTGRKK